MSGAFLGGLLAYREAGRRGHNPEIVWDLLIWLIIGGVVQQYNPTTRQIMQFCGSIVDPLCRPLRRILPRIGALDLSLFALILIIGFLQGYALPRLISLVPF